MTDHQQSVRFHTVELYQDIGHSGESPSPCGDGSPAIRMLLIAAKIWVKTMNAILETVIEVGIDIAVVSCRNGETLIDDFRDRPSLALVRTALFGCSVALDTWMALIAPTGC